MDSNAATAGRDLLCINMKYYWKYIMRDWSGRKRKLRRRRYEVNNSAPSVARIGLDQSAGFWCGFYVRASVIAVSGQATTQSPHTWPRPACGAQAVSRSVGAAFEFAEERETREILHIDQ
jgi:hypothetical protein